MTPLTEPSFLASRTTTVAAIHVRESPRNARNPWTAASVALTAIASADAAPGELPEGPAAQAGSFNDQTQREFGNYLQQVTSGNKDQPLVFYCQSVECWMSYNAALRAVKLGYTQVFWYRGGIEAWQAAGQQIQMRQQ